MYNFRIVRFVDSQPNLCYAEFYRDAEFDYISALTSKLSTRHELLNVVVKKAPTKGKRIIGEFRETLYISESMPGSYINKDEVFNKIRRLFTPYPVIRVEYMQNQERSRLFTRMWLTIANEATANEMIMSLDQSRISGEKNHDEIETLLNVSFKKNKSEANRGMPSSSSARHRN